VLCEACPRSTILVSPLNHSGGIEGSGGTLPKSLHLASCAALGTKVPWSRLDRQKRQPGEIDGHGAVERQHDGLVLASVRFRPLRGVALGPGYCWRRDFLRLCVGLGPLAFDLFVEPGTQGFEKSVDFTLVVAEDHEAA